jgi:hypothetical protein
MKRSNPRKTLVALRREFSVLRQVSMAKDRREMEKRVTASMKLQAHPKTFTL